MLLYINTTDFDSVKFALVTKSSVKEFSKQLAFNENYQTLDLLEKFLSKEGTSLDEVNKIIVCSGPGSFTGIRVGVSMAMAMGFALNIPVTTIPKNKVPSDLIKLISLKLPKTLSMNYGQKPKITKSKKQ